jgi:leucyl-tRNA synthetase
MKRISIRKMMVDYCSSCETVLAREQVKNGGVRDVVAYK